VGLFTAARPYLTSATVDDRSSPLTDWSPAPRQPPCGVGLSARAALSARLWFPVAFRPATFASWSILSCWGLVPPLRSAYWPAGYGPGLTTRPQQGFHVPHRRDATGVGALYTPGPWCPPRAEGSPPWRAWDGVASYALAHHSPPKPSLSAIRGYEASSRVHARSPCQSSPGPVRVDGSPAP